MSEHYRGDSLWAAVMGYLLMGTEQGQCLGRPGDLRSGRQLLSLGEPSEKTRSVLRLLQACWALTGAIRGGEARAEGSQSWGW